MRWLLCLGMVMALLSPVMADVDYDGIDDASTTGLALSTFITASTGSMFVWYTPTGTEPTGTCNAAASQMVLGDTQGFFKINRRNLTQVCVGNSDGATDVVQTGYTNDTPTFLVLVHTGGNIIMYKDGVAVGSPVASGNTASMGNNLIVGGGGTFAPTQGRIHYAAIYDTALAADEVAAMWAARAYRLGRTQATAKWEMNTCGGDGNSAHNFAFHDMSGNGRILTLDDGANNTGVTCRGNTLLTQPYGVQ